MKKLFSFWLDEKIKKSVEKIAKKQKRSIASLIEVELEKMIQNEKNKKHE